MFVCVVVFDSIQYHLFNSSSFLTGSFSGESMNDTYMRYKNGQVVEKDSDMLTSTQTTIVP